MHERRNPERWAGTPPRGGARGRTGAWGRALAVIVTCAALLSGCSSGATTPAPSATPVGGSNPTRIPILIDAEDPVGSTRFLFALTDAANNSIGSPDLPVKVAFFDLGASATDPAATYDATFIWAVPGSKGVYVVNATFGRAGDWAAEFSSTKDGLTERTRVDFPVVDRSSTPRIGDKAPDTPTPTLADVGGDVRRLSTDQAPDPDFYRLSVHDAIAQHKPFVLVFATPAFCQSRQCGPTLDAIKAIAKEEPGIAFINVEPYKMAFANGGLQPVLDGGGNLQPTDVTSAWGLLSEPWIFVVDGTGVVRGTFSLIVSPDELKAAIAAAT